MPYFPNCSLDVVTNNVHEVNTCIVFHCSTDQVNDSQSHAINITVMAEIISLSNCPQLTVHWKCTWSVPKVMRMIFFCSAEGPGKESGGWGRWRGNPGVQFDLPKLSPRLSSSRYVSKVRSSFYVLSWAKMQMSLEQR